MEGPQADRAGAPQRLPGRGRLAAPDAFEAGPWGKRHPAIAQRWRRYWDQVIPFFTFPEGVRRIIYTTDEMDKTCRKKIL